MKLIVGLGNPGKEYFYNRHNIGFLCLNELARTHRIELDRKQGKARVGLGTVAGTEVVLAKPQTYMNLSGDSALLLLDKYRLTPGDLIVIHDDLDLPLGKIRIRRGSGPAGHNGIKSIIARLGTNEFTRIRIGISRPPLEGEIKEESIVDYVLGDFSPADRPVIEDVMKRAGDAVVCLITRGLIQAMNDFN